MELEWPGRISYLFNAWKQSGFDRDRMPDFVARCKMNAPNCAAWLPAVGNSVMSCSESGDWLDGVLQTIKTFKGTGGTGQAWLGEEFLVMLAQLRGPEDASTFGVPRARRT